jgi:FlaA1/EpsC-like NDP-sugar epimerase
MEVVNEYEEKKILVTGGAGCIGTNKLFFYKETFTKEMK